MLNVTLLWVFGSEIMGELLVSVYPSVFTSLTHQSSQYITIIAKLGWNTMLVNSYTLT
jgi:hypothetical protein